jgi:hypothetical protein
MPETAFWTIFRAVGGGTPSHMAFRIWLVGTSLLAWSRR